MENQDGAFVYNGFEYSKEGINYPDEIKIPHQLFKYYAFNEKSIESFINGYLYFSHPNQLNDLTDSSELLLDFKTCDEKYYNFFYRVILKRKNNDITPYNISKEDGFREMALITHLRRMSHRGILSLTANPFNNLMMPHYTSEKGFILEFDTSKLVENCQKISDEVKLFPMNYVEDLKPINYFDTIWKEFYLKNGAQWLRTDETAPFMYMLSVKDKLWKYENEWRVVIHKENLGYINSPVQFNNLKCDSNKRKISFNQKYINKLILGPAFFNNYNFKKEDFEETRKKYFYTINDGLPIEELKRIKSFLDKISSEDFSTKIFIQNIGFTSEGRERFCFQLNDIDLMVMIYLSLRVKVISSLEKL